MVKKRIWMFISLLAILLLSGCNMRTVDEMYHPPKRPEAYNSLSSQINDVMSGREYQAPLSGENRQAVQSADLDGDGIAEYLLFTKSGSEKPLQMHIFSGDGETYRLLDTIESTGTAFELVEYMQMDGRPGLEIVVGRQLSDQVIRNVSVYTLRDGQIEQLVTAVYSKFVCNDLDRDGLGELLVLRPGQSDSDNGIAELYGVENDVIERSQEVNMSEPAASIKRIMVGKLADGLGAVYVASDVDESAIITDVYAVVNGVFTNVSFSSESGTSVQTLRNYYVYADDIDDDGVLELPNLITMVLPFESNTTQWQYLIRWYAMRSDGTEEEKIFTYHNYVGGWYMELRSELVNRICVEQQGNTYIFSLWDEEYRARERIVSLYVLTGQNREEQAMTDNRFVLHRTESTVYAANLDVSSAIYGISKEELLRSFHMIQQDWNTGET